MQPSLQYSTYPITVNYSKPILVFPGRGESTKRSRARAYLSFPAGDTSNEYPPALSGVYAEKMENASMNSEQK